MDISDAVEKIGATLSALKTLKSFIKKLPKNEDRESAEKAMKLAEENLKLAEADIAAKLEYPLCKRHWPPEIMVSIGYSEDDPYREDFRCRDPECDGEYPGKEPPSGEA